MQISDTIPGVNIICEKVSIVSINGAAGSRGVLRPQWGFRGQSTQRKFLGSKVLLDWFKIDLDAAEVIIVQDYKYKTN